MQLIKQSFPVEFNYNVYFTENLFEPSNSLLASSLGEKTNGKPHKVFFVIDSGVMAHCPELSSKIKNYTTANGSELELCAEPMVVSGGEEAKNDIQLVFQIAEATSKFKIDRHSYIIAIGGGAVLDMAGFAAAISHRGIRHVRIPTTVLSQNDSGVGVKNGVNYFGKKNYLGTFAPPFAVINDYDFLQTLDDRDWRSGISEALKVALIKDVSFFEEIKANVKGLASRELAPMKSLIFRCAQMHVDHISGNGDPFEMGSSRPLDFGHWAAHKLEKLSNFQIRHGEAVAIGIAIDVTYSYLTKRLVKPEWKEVIDTLLAIGFDIFHPDLEQEAEDGRKEIIKGLQEFREHLGGELTIMLLEKIGKGVEVHEMDENLLLECLEILKIYE
ncbi:3-dehydroquinate synthase [Flammeovirgaceae bacterium SG7u.111]|nr:3-dehydroquinate synthase [Flammeovirgaceae bacterium SG7u.132]WPO35434.1 3-dehydroquinate synthase [Flammeovirgaceae bacterium SG7u.111]